MPPRAGSASTARTQQAWSERARAELQRAGHRRGGARELLIDLLEQERCALTVQEMGRRLNGRYEQGVTSRPVGIASVYRGIEVLADLGLVARVEVGDGISRYERVAPEQSEAHHHHHFVCDSCGCLVPFDDTALEQAIVALEHRVGFAVSGHEVVLHGACSGCC